MPTPGMGHKSYIQIGEESTFGTAVAATQRLEVISMDINPVIGVIPDPSLNNQQSRRALYQGGLLYRGKIVTRANYEGGGFHQLLKAAMGSLVTTGAGPFTHTFKEAASPPSDTIEMIEGDIPAGQEQELVGSIVTGFTFRIGSGLGADAMGRFEFDFLAKDKVSGQTPTAALTAPATEPVLFHQATTIDEGSDDTAANIRVRSVELTLTNPYADDRFYQGSINIDQPIRNDFLIARWRFEQEFITKVLFDRAKAFTTANLNLIYTQAANTLTFRSNKAQLVEYGNPIEDYGIIKATATWEAFYDATDASALVIVLVNDTATP